MLLATGNCSSYSCTLLVRWLSGRKQRFAKAPYLSKGTEGSNPSLTAISRDSNFTLALPILLSGHVGDENGVRLVGREAHGLNPAIAGSNSGANAKRWIIPPSPPLYVCCLVFDV